jgi:hypothetical protein
MRRAGDSGIEDRRRKPRVVATSWSAGSAPMAATPQFAENPPTPPVTGKPGLFFLGPSTQLPAERNPRGRGHGRRVACHIVPAVTLQPAAAHVPVVEDDDGLRETRVEMEGCSFAHSSNGRTALGWPEHLSRPWARFLAALAERPDRTDLPVIVSSANPATHTLARFSGVTATLLKPYESEELLQLLEAIPSPAERGEGLLSE